MAFIKEVSLILVVLAVTCIHSSEGLPLVSPLIKAKWGVIADVGGKVKTVFVKKLDLIKATGSAVGSIITAPFKIVAKAAALKIGALKTLLGFKGVVVKKIIIAEKKKLHALAATAEHKPISKEIHHFVPVVISNQFA